MAIIEVEVVISFELVLEVGLVCLKNRKVDASAIEKSIVAKRAASLLGLLRQHAFVNLEMI